MPAAIYKDEVVGGLTAYELPMYYSEHTDLFIYDIAVKHELQRKGIGHKLLEAIKQWGAQNYLREIFVDANQGMPMHLIFTVPVTVFSSK